MELYIGNRIAELRKKRGMTQEQLARELGVSAPAVSKWETDTSYPDITILCPLARALGTNVDTLLEYEEILSREKANAYMEQILRIRQEEGIEAAEKELQTILHRYPNNIALKFSAAAIYTVFEVGNVQAGEEEVKRWNQEKRALVQRIYESGDLEYRQAATAMLASFALQENDLEKAEVYLKELPDIANDMTSDTTGLWVKFFRQKGEMQKVTEILQKRLFFLATQMNSCLLVMIEPEEVEEERLFKLCSVYQKLDEIIYDGTGESGLVLAIALAKAGREEEAAAHLISYLESHETSLPVPNPLLFAPTVCQAGKEVVSTREFKEMLLGSITADPFCAKLCEREDVRAVIERWQGKGV
ncbi:MAG: helix-turn-helix domain-containing protein [Ruminococcus sp.]|nr:helix-turn-helix domain-containing protein [Ruminococcus sp.]